MKGFFVVIALVASVLGACVPAPKVANQTATTPDPRPDPAINVLAFRGFDKNGEGYYSPNYIIPSTRGDLVSFDSEGLHMLLRVKNGPGGGLWILESSFPYEAGKSKTIPEDFVISWKRPEGLTQLMQWMYSPEAERMILVTEWEGNVFTFVNKKK